MCLSCHGNLELWAFLFHFPLKDSSYSKDEQEHVKYSAESDTVGAECGTCSKATEVVKGTISLVDTWWGAVLRQSWPVEMTYEFLCRNETYFLLNFIQLKFFFLLAELYSSRNSSGNLHPQWPWGTAHEERDMLPVWWQRRHLRISGYQKVSICYQLMICYYLLQRCNL